MAEAPRIVRPKLDRTAPIRSFSEMLRGSPAADGNGSEQPPKDDVVSRTVELGYRVVDDYLKAGQRAAESRGASADGSSAIVRDFQDLAGRMARYASDLTEIWFQLMELSARGAAANGANGAAAAPPAEASPAPPVSEPATREVRIAVQIASAKPVEVLLDLRVATVPRAVVVHSLRAPEAEKPRIRGVTFDAEAGDAPPRLVLRVPATQPAGVYSGLVIDEETSRPIGTISVAIGSDEASG